MAPFRMQHLSVEGSPNTAAKIQLHGGDAHEGNDSMEYHHHLHFHGGQQQGGFPGAGYPEQPVRRSKQPMFLLNKTTYQPSDPANAKSALTMAEGAQNGKKRAVTIQGHAPSAKLPDIHLHVSIPASKSPPPASMMPTGLPMIGYGCGGCGLLLGTGPTIKAMGQDWHVACLKCRHCEEQLAKDGKTSFTVGKNGKPYDPRCYEKTFMKCGLCKKTVKAKGSEKVYHMGKDGRPYHPDCYAEKYLPTCKVCGEHVASSDDLSRVEFQVNKFWHEKYCKKHDLEAPGAKCASCCRARPSTEEWLTVTAGASSHTLCPVCSKSAVVEAKEAEMLYTEVLIFYKLLGMQLKSRPPLLLVDKKTLESHASKEGRVRSKGVPVFHVRGLCLSSIHRTVKTIVQVPTKGKADFKERRLFIDKGATEQSIKCSVSAILVSHGLPSLLTGSIIAHEALHAYFRLKNVTGLKLQVEEGLAQLMAFLWLEGEHRRLVESKKSADEAKLVSYFAYQIRKDPSAIYGDGFRMAHKAYLKAGGGAEGLARLMEYVEQEGQLPRC